MKVFAQGPNTWIVYNSQLQAAPADGLTLCALPVGNAGAAEREVTVTAFTPINDYVEFEVEIDLPRNDYVMILRNPESYDGSGGETEIFRTLGKVTN